MCQVLCINHAFLTAYSGAGAYLLCLLKSKGLDLRSLSHGGLDLLQGWMQEDYLLFSGEGQLADGVEW